MCRRAQPLSQTPSSLLQPSISLALAMQLPSVKGLTEKAIANRFESHTYRTAFAENGVCGFLRCIEAHESGLLERIPNRIGPLLEWGLDSEAASVVASIGDDLHLGPGRAIFAYLYQQSRVPPRWPPTRDGWPANFPPDQFFRSTMGALRDMNFGRPSFVDPTKIGQMVFVSDPARTQAFLPPVAPGRVMVFHATSWSSGVSLESGINLRINMGDPRDIGAGLYVTPCLDYAKWWCLEEPTSVIGGQPMIMIYSLPANYMQSCASKDVFGEGWNDTVRYYRKGAPLSWNPERFDLLRSPICRSANLVNIGEKNPVPLRNYIQMCLKREPAIRDLRFEGAIFYPSKQY